MHKLRFLAALCLMLAACIPDDKEKPKQSRLAYKTYEWVEGELVRAEDDIRILKNSLTINITRNRKSYYLMLGLVQEGDSIAISQPLFKIPCCSYIPYCDDQSRKEQEEMEKRADEYALIPHMMTSKMCNHHNQACFQVFAGYEEKFTDGSCRFRRLPEYMLKDTALFHDWLAVLNYRVKGRDKCLVVQNMDTIFFSQNPETLLIDEDPVKFDPLDSVYYFL